MWQIIGQDRTVDLLSRSLQEGHLSHAYLLVGPKHVGKMTLAMDLARTVNCESGGRPCGECRSCRRITAGKHVDVQVIGIESEESSDNGQSKTKVGIKQIEEIKRDASLPPYEGKYKVFILDGAESLSVEAANSLLKILEEPSPQVLLLLLAARESSLLPTVVSRCRRIELTPLPAGVIEQALVSRWQFKSKESQLMARICNGCLGWAITALEDERLLQQRSERLNTLVKLATMPEFERFTYAAQFDRKRGLAQEVLPLWLIWWRDMLLIKTGCSEMVTNIDYIDILSSEAENCSISQITGCIKSIQESLDQLERNANPRLVMEVLLLDIYRKEREKSGAGHLYPSFTSH